jgi:hypothetical protein
MAAKTARAVALAAEHSDNYSGSDSHSHTNDTYSNANADSDSDSIKIIENNEDKSENKPDLVVVGLASASLAFLATKHYVKYPIIPIKTETSIAPSGPRSSWAMTIGLG